MKTFKDAFVSIEATQTGFLVSIRNITGETCFVRRFPAKLSFDSRGESYLTEKAIDHAYWESQAYAAKLERLVKSWSMVETGA